MPDLIFCAGGNRAFFDIAQEEGFLLGIRSDRSAYNYSIQFVDNHYKKPNFPLHLAAVQRHQPKYATVLDLSDQEVTNEDARRATEQAQQLAPHCATVYFVPKLPGQIALLPEEAAIAYSVPTTYGKAEYPLEEVYGHRVHLLGGSPHKQRAVYATLQGKAVVLSVDGNMAMLMARKFAKYWEKGKWLAHPEKGKGAKDLYLDCWRRSCRNIFQLW